MFASVVALGLVVGLSPLPVIPALLLLVTPGGVSRGLAYLAAWLVGLTGLTALFVLMADVGDPSDQAQQSAGWLEVIIGALLIAGGIFKLFRQRAKRDEPKTPPKWQAALVDYDARRSARLGFAFAVGNPKNLVTAIAVGGEVALLSTSTAQSMAAVGIFVVVGSLGVGVPILSAWLLGERAQPLLTRLQRTLETHGTAISVGVLLLLGSVLVLRGTGIAG